MHPTQEELNFVMTPARWSQVEAAQNANDAALSTIAIAAVISLVVLAVLVMEIRKALIRRRLEAHPKRRIVCIDCLYTVPEHPEHRDRVKAFKEDIKQISSLGWISDVDISLVKGHRHMTFIEHVDGAAKQSLGIAYGDSPCLTECGALEG